MTKRSPESQSECVTHDFSARMRARIGEYLIGGSVAFKTPAELRKEDVIIGAGASEDALLALYKHNQEQIDSFVAAVDAAQMLAPDDRNGNRGNHG